MAIAATVPPPAPSRWRPSLPGLVVGAVVLLAIAFAVFLTGAKERFPSGAPVQVQELRFEDRLDGAVAVYVGNATKPNFMLPPESNHFLRAFLRALARERRLQAAGDGPATPFRLSRWEDGRLLLEDPATGRILDLRAYGETNAEVFGQFLGPRETR